MPNYTPYLQNEDSIFFEEPLIDYDMLKINFSFIFNSFESCFYHLSFKVSDMVDLNRDFLGCSIFQTSIQHFEAALLKMNDVLFQNLDKGLLSTFLTENQRDLKIIKVKQSKIIINSNLVR